MKIVILNMRYFLVLFLLTFVGCIIPLEPKPPTVHKPEPIIPVKQINSAQPTATVEIKKLPKIVVEDEVVKPHSWKDLEWKSASITNIGKSYSEGRPSIVFFMMEDCEDCDKMLNQHWSDPVLIPHFEKITLMLSNIENSSDLDLYKKILEKVNKSTDDTYVPAIVIFLPDGTFLFRQGYLTNKEFIKLIELLNENNQAKSEG
jgi:thiol-disulfide isomerase/thioredoxin